MTRPIPARLAAAAGLLTLFLAGCSGRAPAVRGTVTGPDGQPVADARVTFHPAPGAPEAGPFGARTDPAGRFEVPVTAAVRPGTYRVTVTKFDPAPGAPAGVDAEQLVMMGKARNALPGPFAKPDTTPLEVTVKAGANDIPLEVTK